MMNRTLLLAILATTASAFHVLPRSRYGGRLVLQATKESKDLTFNPAEGYKGVDLARAKECADNFGKCSVEEIEELKSNLHKERLQNFGAGGSGMTKPEEDALEHRLLEEELELQLSLLKDHDDPSANPGLFPKVEPPMEELPHLKDTPEKEYADNLVHKVEQELAYEETVLGEANLETLVICGVVLALALAPQFLHN